RRQRARERLARQGALATRTAQRICGPPRYQPVGPRLLDGSRWLDGRVAEQLLAPCQLGSHVTTGQYAIMANADEAFWQHMQQETAHEFFSAYRHDLEPMMVGIILPAKTHVAILHGYQAGVGDGHAMRVAPQVAKDLLGASERPLGIDDPLLLVQPIQQAGKPAPIP